MEPTRGTVPVGQVREALARLHDLPYLQTHPLARRLPATAAAPGRSAGESLHRALVGALAALKAPDAPTASDRARIHRLLDLAYVEGLPVGEVCRRLGLSKSVYYREHARGVAALAAVLAARWLASATLDAPAAATTGGAAPRWPGAAPLTSFVGREAELRDLRRLLEASRLVTLTGPPGCGKTRLARALLAELAAEFPEGAHFVSLAPLRDPDLALPTVAEAVGARPGRGRTLAEALGERRLLLVLDNAEHLPGVGPALAELAANTPRLQLVVTSRALLRVYGEQGYPVPPLALPEPGDLPPLEALAASPAVRLFVERARAARPGFALTADNAAAVVAVCRRLDGLPLAIELAAAWARLLPPSALLARLERRLSVLVGGPRDQLEHHRSLRGAIGWSYELLEPEEQVVLRRLGVFVGSAGLDAAASVADPDDPRPDAVLAAIGRLVDQSLVQPAEATGDDARVVLLETIREFALDALAAAGEQASTERAHAAYFRAFARSHEPDWGPEQPARLEWLERDEGNLRAALAWALARDAESALDLGAALWPLWRVRGRWAEGHAWLRRVLALPGAEQPTPARAAVLHGAGLLAAHLEPPDSIDARPLLTESLALWRRLGDRRQVAWVWRALAHLAQFEGDRVALEACCREGLALSRAVGDNVGAASCLNGLAAATYAVGERERAVDLAEESLALARDAGSDYHSAHALHALATFALDRGDLAEARAWLEAALRAARTAGDPPFVGSILIDLGYVAHAQGDRATAAALTAEGLVDIPGGSTTVIARAWELRTTAEDALGAADHDRAAETFCQALRLMRARPLDHDVPACLAGLAEVAGPGGAPWRAACLLGAAAAIERANKVVLISARSWRPTPDTEAIRAALGPEAFAAAWAAGEAMSLSEAIDYALRPEEG